MIWGSRGVCKWTDMQAPCHSHSLAVASTSSEDGPSRSRGFLYSTSQHFVHEPGTHVSTRYFNHAPQSFVISPSPSGNFPGHPITNTKKP